jgi:hypothetical protein
LPISAILPKECSFRKAQEGVFEEIEDNVPAKFVPEHLSSFSAFDSALAAL